MTKASFSSAVSSSFPETICSSSAGSLSVSAFSVASSATTFGPEDETQMLGVPRNHAFLRPDELPLFSSVLSESVLSASTIVPSTFGDTPKASVSPFAADASATTRRPDTADLLFDRKTASAASSSLLPHHLYYYDAHQCAVNSPQHDEVGTAFQQSGEENEEEKENGQRATMQQLTADRLKGHSRRYEAVAASPTRAHKASFRQNGEEALWLFRDNNYDAAQAKDRIAALLADEELPAQQAESRREEEEEMSALESFRLQLQKVIQITSRGLSLQKAIAIVMSDSSNFAPPSFVHSASSSSAVSSRALSSAPLPTSSPFRSSLPLLLKPSPAASPCPQSTLLGPRVSAFEGNGHYEPLLSRSRDSQVGDGALPASTVPVRCLSSPFSSPISSASAIASFMTAPSTQDRFRRVPPSSPTSSSCGPLLPLRSPNNGSNVMSLTHRASLSPTLSNAALSNPPSPSKADPRPCSVAQAGDKKHIPSLCSVLHSFSAPSLQAPSLSLQPTSFQSDREQLSLSPRRRKKQQHVSADFSSTIAVTSSTSPPEEHGYCSHSMSTAGASSANLPAPLPQRLSSSSCSSSPLPTSLVAPPNSSVLPSSSSFPLSTPDNSSYPIDISPFQIRLNLNFPHSTSCSAADSRSSTHGLAPPPTVRVRVLDGDCDIRSSAAKVSFLYPQATHLTAVVEDGPETLAVVRVRVLEEA